MYMCVKGIDFARMGFGTVPTVVFFVFYFISYVELPLNRVVFLQIFPVYL